MKSLDSVHFATLAGSVGGWFLANYDRVAGCACALAGLLYTLWKWRRDSRRESARLRAEAARLDT